MEKSVANVLLLKAERNFWDLCDLKSFQSGYKGRLEIASISDVLYLFGQGNCVFIRKKTGIVV